MTHSRSLPDWCLFSRAYATAIDIVHEAEEIGHAKNAIKRTASQVHIEVHPQMLDEKSSIRRCK